MQSKTNFAQKNGGLDVLLRGLRFRMEQSNGKRIQDNSEKVMEVNVNPTNLKPLLNCDFPLSTTESSRNFRDVHLRLTSHKFQAECLGTNLVPRYLPILNTELPVGPAGPSAVLTPGYQYTTGLHPQRPHPSPTA